jgi:hypothetical protein
MMGRETVMVEVHGNVHQFQITRRDQVAFVDPASLHVVLVALSPNTPVLNDAVDGTNRHPWGNKIKKLPKVENMVRMEDLLELISMKGLPPAERICMANLWAMSVGATLPSKGKPPDPDPDGYDLDFARMSGPPMLGSTGSRTTGRVRGLKRRQLDPRTRTVRLHRPSKRMM